MNNLRKFILTMFLGIVLLVITYEGVKIADIYSKDPCDMKDGQRKEIVTDQQSWSFLGIMVGKSTDSDVINKLGEPDYKSPQYSGEKKPVGCVFQYRLNDEESPMSISARYIWLSKGPVIAMEFSGPGYPVKEDNSPASLADLKSLYGPPDIISFSKQGPFYRTVIWLQKGIQAIIVFSGNSSTDTTVELDKAFVSSIYYFPPTNLKSFRASIYAQISEERSSSDVVDLFPQDPFRWSK